MIIYNKLFHNTNEMKDFVSLRENKFKSQTETIADLIAENENIKIITLSGPSCAGKTTSSYILQNTLEKGYGIDSKIISIDNFFKNREHLFKQKNPDFESIDAIDFEYFKLCVNNILNGKKTELPIYNFITGEREAVYDLYIPHKNGVIIFEGIQAMYPEITAILPYDKTASIYIDILDDVYAYGSLFSRRDIRFYRRLVRDFKFRGADVSKTLYLWKNVLKNEEKNIFPYSFSAKYSINSSLLYEINVIKSFLFDLLSSDAENKELHEKIYEKFKNVPDIPADFVPKDSVFREFIG